MRRIPQLDGLRAVAILMVFATHALSVPALWMGVDLFFVLSGYLITGILLRLKERRSTEGYWKPFYFRRIRRIIPPYLGFLVLLSLFFRVPWARLWYWYAFFGANFALAFGKVTLAAMAPLWSLAVEEQFYLVWPWIVLLCSREALRKIAFAVIVLSPILRAIFTPAFASHFPIYSLTVFRCDTLAAGAFIAVSEIGDAHWIGRRRRDALLSAVLAGLMFGILSLFSSFRTGANSILFNSIGYSLSVILLGGTLAYALSLRQGLLYNTLTAQPVRYLGLISYTFYLYHVAVLLQVERYVHSTIPVAALAFAITVAISAISWYCFESRILKVSQMQLRPRKPVP
jgi:peptidoglycan/LPS O-acetylase OafA/YrhL